MQNLNRPIERRHKLDGIIKFVNIASILGWIMILICAMLTIYAKPEQTNLFFEMFNIPIREYWNYSLLNVVFTLLEFLFVLTLIGIFMNAMRQRRKTDKIKKSLIFQLIMSLVGMILLYINSIV